MTFASNALKLPSPFGQPQRSRQEIRSRRCSATSSGRVGEFSKNALERVRDVLLLALFGSAIAMTISATNGVYDLRLLDSFRGAISYRFGGYGGRAMRWACCSLLRCCSTWIGAVKYLTSIFMVIVMVLVPCYFDNRIK